MDRKNKQTKEEGKEGWI